MTAKTISLAAVAAAVVIAPLAFAGAPPSGQAIGFTCAGCHGTAGVSQGTAPSIAGEDADDLKEMMLDFKSGKEKSTIMGRIAKGYSDEELAAVAEYFSKQEGEE